MNGAIIINSKSKILFLILIIIAEIIHISFLFITDNLIPLLLGTPHSTQTFLHHKEKWHLWSHIKWMWIQPLSIPCCYDIGNCLTSLYLSFLIYKLRLMIALISIAIYLNPNFVITSCNIIAVFLYPSKTRWLLPVLG